MENILGEAIPLNPYDNHNWISQRVTSAANEQLDVRGTIMEATYLPLCSAIFDSLRYSIESSAIREYTRLPYRKN